MPEKPEIEKLRALHDLHTQFDVPEAIRKTLESQLSLDDQGRVERFNKKFGVQTSESRKTAAKATKAKKAAATAR